MDRPTDAKDCIICNKAARDAITNPRAIEITEELLAEQPADCIPGVGCWNCYDLGYTVPIDSPNSDAYQTELKHRIATAFAGGTVQ